MTNNQSTSHILMIRPVNFGFNEETAGSNAFQNRNAAKDGVNEKAQQEFDRMVNTLRGEGVDVTVVDDTPEPYTPDSIFPNNWVSFHADGNVFLYPMQAENRRLERREDVIAKLEDDFAVKHIIDLSRFETEDKFLEGTGSMVLDRVNKIVYACLSPRTDREVLNLFCEQAGYTPVSFDAVDEKGQAIYHTNVLMCIGSGFAVICLDSIPNPHEKILVKESLQSTQKEIIDISFEQMNSFAGNMLEVNNNKGEALIVMSKNAFSALDEEQKATLKKYGKLVYSDINTIEANGGGSTRCMMAEVHLPEAHS
ncbi:citrulline utilization hydrolase CtlX [Mucilaginibacter sp. L3T2-6]|uniref:citrulline utilization hydrolase CtlX n=1 Tax=Mucilaginibacter sp. L3T2-6 TaxID=3062491 RepID=UPI002675C727|nr:arginine deiminase-related protein [Mucilaginibacter sp. L3T2-6]MDO3641121.1 arginine deiminase-related protein [Mucilaginibacter sp. L3T2-6]MDV6213403.1 arginine deiminase-related protein [Mucilaginibacter sp. L3T2-6]